MTIACRACAALVALGVLAADPAIAAQPARSIPVVGILLPGSASETLLPSSRGFGLGLRDLGYVEGTTIRLERRWSDGHDDRFPALAGELVGLRVNIIVAVTVPAIRAAQRATTTIPIVMILSSDPVRLGLVKSLARPGGNTTGPASLTFDLSRKRLELLKEAVPTLTEVVVLMNPTNPAIREGLRETNVAAHGMGLKVRSFEVHEPTEFEGVFAAMRRARPRGLIVVPDPLLLAQAARVAQFAMKNRVPVVYGAREFIEGAGSSPTGSTLRTTRAVQRGMSTRS